MYMCTCYYCFVFLLNAGIRGELRKCLINSTLHYRMREWDMPSNYMYCPCIHVHIYMYIDMSIILCSTVLVYNSVCVCVCVCVCVVYFSGPFHFERRRYLRTALNELCLLLSDQPGLMGPKVSPQQRRCHRLHVHKFWCVCVILNIVKTSC